MAEREGRKNKTSNVSGLRWVDGSNQLTTLISFALFFFSSFPFIGFPNLAALSRGQRFVCIGLTKAVVAEWI
jgi:hypothetical protein